MGYWADCAAILGQYWHHTKQTGSAWPSSSFLARALASEMARQPRGPARILEVGPGTGVVTRQIARRLGPEDRLDVVELNDRFVEILRQRFAEEEVFRCLQDRLQLIHGPVEQVPGESAYDFIVSGLPLNAFKPEQVKEVFRTLKRLSKPGGALSYFEYILVRHLQAPFAGREGRRKLARIGRIVGHYIRKCQFRRQQVWLNVTPAYVRHLRLK